MTRSRLLISQTRQLSRRARAPRLEAAPMRSPSAAGHLAKQLEQHRPFGR